MQTHRAFAFLPVLAAMLASCPLQAAPQSTKFVTQILEPTGGRIDKPKGWFYAERHRGPVFDWTISREDSDRTGGRYDTGVRIQLFSAVKKGTGESAKQFVMDSIKSKKAAATKVIRTGKATKQGLFTRICLETEEGPYRILYTFFYGNDDLDLAALSIAGAPKEEWATYAPIFDRMSAFQIIDMKRFQD